MLWSVLFALPWLMPLGMAALNLASLISGVLNEGRLKMGAAKFSLMYASTIPSAMRGDLQPFMTVLVQPPTN